MTGAEITECLEIALSTVSGVLARRGKLSRLEPPEPPNRYECVRAGELAGSSSPSATDEATRPA